MHVQLILIVRALGRFARLPGPDLAVLADDDGLVLVGGDPAGFHAFWQIDGCKTGHVVGQMIDAPVRVQEEEPLAESPGLADVYARVLLDAFGLGSSGVARVPGPGLPVRVHDEGTAGGCDGEDGLCLSGQSGRGRLGEFRVQVLAACLAGLECMDPTLSVHCQETLAVHADARELGVRAGVESYGFSLLPGPGVDVLVGAQCGLPLAAGCGLQIAEPVGRLVGERNLLGCVVLCPGVDAAVASQADCLLSCGLYIAETWLLSTG